MPTQDVANATSKYQITSESVSFADGAAGTAQRLKLTYDGVMNQYGERIGSDGDSSFSFGTGTVLVTEIPWKYKNTEGKDNETDRLSSLANGEYMVDYLNGYILGKNAVSTSSSTDTASYKVRLNAITSIGGGDASAANQSTQITAEQAIQTAVEAMDDWDESNRAKVNPIAGQVGVAGGTGAVDAATQRTVMATDSPDVTSLQLIDDAIFTDDAAYTPGTSKGAVIMGQADETGTDSVDEGDAGAVRISLRRALKTDMDTLLSGEDQTNGVFKVEGQFSGSQATADAQVKATAGFLHAVTFMCTDAAPTAGSIIVYDSAAESGTVVCNLQVSTVFFNPFTLIFDRVMGTGIYVGFTTTADVACQVEYR